MSGFFASARRLLSRLMVILFSLAVLVGVIGWMSGWFHPKIQPSEAQPAQREPAPGQQRAVARILRTPQTVEVVGTIEPYRKVTVASQLMATIHRVLVRAGQHVEAGQLLIELDDRELQAQRREAEAGVVASTAELALRKRELERHKIMLDGEAVTKEQYDTVRGSYEVAQAQHSRAQEQLQRVKTMLSHTRIHAGTAVLVTDRFVDPGDLAAPGKPLLTLHDPQQLEIHASVPEKLAHWMRPGMALALHIDAASLDVEGTLREIVLQVQAGSRSMLMKIRLPPEKSSDLYVGMFGRVYLSIGHTDRLVIPAAAVQNIGQLQLVEVVQPDKGLEHRFVQTGRRFGDEVEVLAGLSRGEAVLVPQSSLASAPKRP